MGVNPRKELDNSPMYERHPYIPAASFAAASNNEEFRPRYKNTKTIFASLCVAIVVFITLILGLFFCLERALNMNMHWNKDIDILHNSDKDQVQKFELEDIIRDRNLSDWTNFKFPIQDSSDEYAPNYTDSRELNRTPVYTFFHRLPETPSVSAKSHINMIRMWARSWFAKGYFPHVLTLRDARKHPDFIRLARKFAQLPTINPKTYELVCYLRWLAFEVAGGGIFMDYDIFATSSLNLTDTMFKPKDNKNVTNLQSSINDLPSDDESMITTFLDLVPMFTFAQGKKGVKRIISALESYKINPKKDLCKGQMHISDMIILGNNAKTVYDNVITTTPNFLHIATDSFNRYKLHTKQSLTKHEWTAKILELSFYNQNAIKITDQSLTTELRCPIEFDDELFLKKIVPSTCEFKLNNLFALCLPNYPKSTCSIQRAPVLNDSPENDFARLVYEVGTKKSIDSAIFVPQKINEPDGNRLILEYMLGFRFSMEQNESPLPSVKYDDNSEFAKILQTVSRIEAKIDLL